MFKDVHIVVRLKPQMLTVEFSAESNTTFVMFPTMVAPNLRLTRIQD